MKKNISYESKEKKYYIKSKRKVKPIVWGYLCLIGAFLILGLGTVCIFQSVGNKRGQGITYNELGSVDYKVYLKDNNYYDEKYLTSGMKYIANLINIVGVNFAYDIHSSKNLNYNYNYQITADLIITDDTNSDKVLYQKRENLLKKTSKNVVDNDFQIRENIDIDYDKYNEYVAAYKKDNGILVNSYLLVTMHIEATGDTKTVSEKLNSSNDLILKIPLIEKTIDISLETKNIDHKDSIGTTAFHKVNSPFLLGIAILLEIIGVSLLGFSSYILYKIKQQKENIYYKTIHKLLKEYDRMIIEGSISFNEDDFKVILKPNTFKELLDAHYRTEKPIYYYEVVPGERSYFTIADEDTLYTFKITRSYLEKHQTEKSVSQDYEAKE